MSEEQIKYAEILQNADFVAILENVTGKKLAVLQEEYDDDFEGFVREFIEEQAEVCFNMEYTDESGWTGGTHILKITSFYILKDFAHEDYWFGPFNDFDTAFACSSNLEFTRDMSGDWAYHNSGNLFDLTGSLPSEKLVQLCHGWNCKFTINGIGYISDENGVRLLGTNS